MKPIYSRASHNAEFNGRSHFQKNVSFSSISGSNEWTQGKNNFFASLLISPFFTIYFRNTTTILRLPLNSLKSEISIMNIVNVTNASCATTLLDYERSLRNIGNVEWEKPMTIYIVCKFTSPCPTIRIVVPYWSSKQLMEVRVYHVIQINLSVNHFVSVCLSKDRLYGEMPWWKKKWKETKHWKKESDTMQIKMNSASNLSMDGMCGCGRIQ